MNRESTCLLCGTTSKDVTTGLWRRREKYAAIPRCRDQVACRTRVEALGGEWELEGRPVGARDLIR